LQEWRLTHVFGQNFSRQRFVFYDDRTENHFF